MKDRRTALLKHCFRVYDTLGKQKWESKCFDNQLKSAYCCQRCCNETWEQNSFKKSNAMTFRQFIFLENVAAILHGKSSMCSIMQFIVQAWFHASLLLPCSISMPQECCSRGLVLHWAHTRLDYCGLPAWNSAGSSARFKGLQQLIYSGWARPCLLPGPQARLQALGGTVCSLSCSTFMFNFAHS